MAKPTTSLSWRTLKCRNDASYAAEAAHQKRAWWEANKEKHRGIVRAWFDKLPDKATYLRERSRKRKERYPETYTKPAKDHVRRLRDLVHKALGGSRCNACGYSVDVRALCLDHRNGGGQIEMRRLNYNLPKLYRMILGMPEAERLAKYQVLCANCNRIKQFENGEFGKGPTYYKTLKAG